MPTVKLSPLVATEASRRVAEIASHPDNDNVASPPTAFSPYPAALNTLLFGADALTLPVSVDAVSRGSVPQTSVTTSLPTKVLLLASVGVAESLAAHFADASAFCFESARLNDALAACAQTQPHVVMLAMQQAIHAEHAPEDFAFEIVRGLRAAPATQNLPLILLYAEDDAASRTLARTLKVDDYFSLDALPIEFFARLNALVWRTALTSSPARAPHPEKPAGETFRCANKSESDAVMTAPFNKTFMHDAPSAAHTPLIDDITPAQAIRAALQRRARCAAHPVSTLPEIKLAAVQTKPDAVKVNLAAATPHTAPPPADGEAHRFESDNLPTGDTEPASLTTSNLAPETLTADNAERENLLGDNLPIENVEADGTPICDVKNNNSDATNATNDNSGDGSVSTVHGKYLIDDFADHRSLTGDAGFTPNDTPNNANQTPAPAVNIASRLDLHLLVVMSRQSRLAPLNRALYEAGIKLRVAFDAQQAADLLRLDTSFNLCLIDAELRDANGWQVAARLRRTHPKLPVILLEAETLAPHRPVTRFYAQPVSLQILENPSQLIELMHRVAARSC